MKFGQNQIDSLLDRSTLLRILFFLENLKKSLVIIFDQTQKK
jgi:hypothetical protein